MPAYTNKFSSPAFVEDTILTDAGNVIGKLRIKPNRVLWKPSGQQKFYSVSLDAFREWITSAAAGATRTGS